MNRIIKQRKLILLLFLGLFFNEGANAQQQLTLKQALNYAVENSENARKARLDIDGGRFKTQEIRSQALPQLKCQWFFNL